MKGLAFAEEYYRAVCAPAIREALPHDYDRISAGLVGDGSEAFGFDDELSRDHDFTPLCCYWLRAEDMELAPKLEAVLRDLPGEYRGFPVREEGMREDKRRGVWEIGAFYSRFLGVPGVPETVGQWLRPPESSFAQVTNGAVFFDGPGVFSAIRRELLLYYPDDIRLLILAGQCIHMAQAGQYNYPRCVKRGEPVAASMAESEFVRHAMRAVYALNQRYMPYYKWAHRGMRSLGILGPEVSNELLQLTALPPDSTDEKAARIESVCRLVIGALRAEGLSDRTEDFLLPHGDCIRQRIENRAVRAVDPFLL